MWVVTRMRSKKTTRQNRSILLVVLTAALMCLTPASISVANGLPVLWMPTFPGDIQPDTETGIALVHEELSMEIDDALQRCWVRVVYRLKNTATEPRSVSIVFPSGEGDSEPPRVHLDNERISARSEQVSPEQIGPPLFLESIPLVDPVTAEVYGSSEPSWRGMLTYFEVEIGAGETSVVAVEYITDAGRDFRTRPNVVHVYHYALTPARAWQNVGVIDIQISVPESAFFGATESFSASSQDHRQIYTLTLEGKPEKDLAFSVMSRTGLVFGAQRWVYDALRIALPFALGLLLAALVARPWFGLVDWLNSVIVLLSCALLGAAGAFSGGWMLVRLIPVDMLSAPGQVLVAFLLLPVACAVVATFFGLGLYHRRLARELRG